MVITWIYFFVSSVLQKDDFDDQNMISRRHPSDDIFSFQPKRVIREMMPGMIRFERYHLR